MNSGLGLAGAVILWTLLLRDWRRLPWPAVIVFALVRWLALTHWAAPWTALLVSQAAPRGAAVWLIYFSRPLDIEYSAGVRAWHAALALVVAAACAVPAGIRFGWFALGCCVVLTSLFQWFTEARFGGAGPRQSAWLERSAECVILTTAACSRCQW